MNRNYKENCNKQNRKDITMNHKTSRISGKTLEKNLRIIGIKGTEITSLKNYIRKLSKLKKDITMEVQEA